MLLELNDEERLTLRHALESYVSSLREEIVKTENKDWRIGLHNEKEQLKCILERLASSPGQTEHDEGSVGQIAPVRR